MLPFRIMEFELTVLFNKYLVLLNVTGQTISSTDRPALEQLKTEVNRSNVGIFMSANGITRLGPA